MRFSSLLSTLIASMILVLVPGNLIAGEQPILRLDGGGHLASVKKVVFSPNGRELYTASDDKTIMVWDTATGERIRVLRGEIGQGNEGRLYALDISPDGQMLAAGGVMESKEIRLVNPLNGTILGLLMGHTSGVLSLKFSPDGKTLASASGDETIRLWDVKEHKLLHTFEGHSDHVFDLSWHPEGKQLVSSGNDGRLILWDIETGALVEEVRASAKTKQAGVHCSYSDDGKLIVTGDHGGLVLVWDSETLKCRKEIIHLDKGYFSRSIWWGTKLLMGGYYCLNHEETERYPVVLFDTIAGGKPKQFLKHTNTIFDITLNTANRPLIASSGGNNNEIWLWDPETVEPVHELKGNGNGVWAVGVGKEGNQLAFGNRREGSVIEATTPIHRAFDLDRFALVGDNQFCEDDYDRNYPKVGHQVINATARLYLPDLTINGNTIEWPLENDTIRCFTYTRDGQTAIVGSEFGLYKFDGETGERLGSFVGHEGTVWSVSPSRNGKLLVSGSWDNTIKIWDIETCELLVSLFVDEDNEWVMWTPSGYYTSSANSGQYIGWHINRGKDQSAEYYTVDQFSEIYDRPDIVRQTLLMRSEPRGIEVANELSRNQREQITGPVTEIKPPEITYISPGEGSTVNTREAALCYRIDSILPIDEVVITVNGRRIGGTRALGRVRQELANEDKEPAGPNETEEILTISLQPGLNEIAIFTRHQKAKASKTLRIYGPETLDSKPQSDQLPRLFLIAIGVDKYDHLSEQYQLEYPDDDAREIDQIFQKLKGETYGEVQTVLMTASEGENAPTSDNIIDAMALFEEATQNDTCILFVAGHGIRDRKGSFYFVPRDVKFHEQRGELRKSSMVLWAEFKEALKVPGKRMMFIDTCHSGGASGIQDNAVNKDELLKKMQSDSLLLMAACQGDEESLEHSEWGHGAFTKAFMEGTLDGKADLNKDNNVTVHELEIYVKNRVKELTDNTQTPRAIIPKGMKQSLVYKW